MTFSRTLLAFGLVIIVDSIHGQLFDSLNPVSLISNAASNVGNAVMNPMKTAQNSVNKAGQMIGNPVRGITDVLNNTMQMGQNVFSNTRKTINDTISNINSIGKKITDFATRQSFSANDPQVSFIDVLKALGGAVWYSVIPENIPAVFSGGMDIANILLEPYPYLAGQIPQLFSTISQFI